ETTQLINTKKELKEEKDLDSQTEEPEETKQPTKQHEKEEAEDLAEEHITEEKQEPEKKQVKETMSLKHEDLEQMTVRELRKLVREKNVMKDDTNNIKYAKKTELVKSLLNENNKNHKDEVE